MLHQGKDFQPRAGARHQGKDFQPKPGLAVSSKSAADRLSAPASRKRKAIAPAKAVPSQRRTARKSLHNSHSRRDGSMPEQAQQTQQGTNSLSQKPSAKRQKDPPSALQTPSMQTPAAAASHTHLLSSTQAQQPDAARLIPDPRTVDNVAMVASDSRPVDSAAVVPAMPDIRSRPSPASPAGTAGPRMQPAQQQGGLHAIQGQHAFQPSSAGTSGLSIQAAQQQGGLHTAQGQQGPQAALADAPQQQSDVVHHPLAPDQTQSSPHLATGSNPVSSREVKHEQDQLQQEADADRAGEAVREGVSARSQALSQLIARAKKLKDQLDAHARRNALR